MGGGGVKSAKVGWGDKIRNRQVGRKWPSGNVRGISRFIIFITNGWKKVNYPFCVAQKMHMVLKWQFFSNISN